MVFLVGREQGKSFFWQRPHLGLSSSPGNVSDESQRAPLVLGQGNIHLGNVYLHLTCFSSRMVNQCSSRILQSPPLTFALRARILDCRHSHSHPRSVRGTSLLWVRLSTTRAGLMTDSKGTNNTNLWRCRTLFDDDGCCCQC